MPLPVSSDVVRELRAAELHDARRLHGTTPVVYADPRLQGQEYRQEILAFARSRGVPQPKSAPAPFSADTVESVRQQAEALTARFFSGETGQRVREQMDRFVALTALAQQEGDVPKTLRASDVLQLVHENLAVLALQTDHANREVFGDHGVWHVLHNLAAGQRLLDEVDARRRQAGRSPLRAVDRLLFQQAMMLHDAARGDSLIYALSRTGLDVADAHPLLMAKLLLDRYDQPMPGDPLLRIFGSEYATRVLHEAIRTHDAVPDRFNLVASDFATRQRNVLTATRIGDGTHIFDSKLPALMRRPLVVPLLYVLKTADELGAPELAARAVRVLQRVVDADRSLQPFERDAVCQAASSVNGTTYAELLSRVFGADPEVFVCADGRVHVHLEESRLYDRLQAAFALPGHSEPLRLIQELTGHLVPEGVPGASTEKGSAVVVEWDQAPAGELPTAYQRSLAAELTSVGFFSTVTHDKALAAQGKNAQRREALAGFLDLLEERSDGER